MTFFKPRRTRSTDDDELILQIHAEAKRKYPGDKILQEYHEYVKWIQSDIKLSPDMVKRIPNPPECLIRVINSNYRNAILWSKETKPVVITQLLCRDMKTCVYASLLPGASEEMRDTTRKRLEMHLLEQVEELVENKETPLDFSEIVNQLEALLDEIVYKCAGVLEQSAAEDLEQASKRTVLSTGRLIYASNSASKEVSEYSATIMEDIRMNLNHVINRLHEANSISRITVERNLGGPSDLTLDALMDKLSEIMPDN